MKKRYFIILFLFIFQIPTFSAHVYLEREYQEKWCKQNNGITNEWFDAFYDKETYQIRELSKDEKTELSELRKQMQRQDTDDEDESAIRDVLKAVIDGDFDD